MAKIVINALSARLGGGKTYIRNFLAHLDDANEYIVLVGPYNRSQFEEASRGKADIRFYDCGKRQANPLWRLFWERFVLSSLLRKWNVDVYYAAGGGTFVKVTKPTVSATVIRNMLPFDRRERARFPLFSSARLKLSFLRRIALYAVRRCDKVIFVSDYSRCVVARLVSGISEKGRVIPHGVDEHFFHSSDREFDFSRFGVERGKFYLYVSIFNHYKAQVELVREWGMLVKEYFPYPLVLTGFLQPGYTEQVRKTISDLGLEKNVIITGPVSYDELPAYYAGARALVFASSCECCPNILLEMMATGKPIFCSDFPPMPEIGGEAPIYFNPYIEGDLAGKIIEAERCFERTEERGKLNSNRAGMFDWNRTVDETIRFLTE
ncbi:MAG: glycosyltransferase family 4 protein [Thermoguttaceae bacterium]|jgi:glycosyltransferase involved in cell wall biosynthesis